MRGLAIAALTALLVASIAGAVYGDEGYAALVEDANLKIAVYYPPEVKVGECFNLRFQADAFNNMTIDLIRLTITYYYNGRSATLYDEKLAESLDVERGWVLTKTISVCVPERVSRDPFLEARVNAQYELETDGERELSHEWYMSIVRDMTYEEVLSELEDAEDRIESLEKQVDDLLDEIDELLQSVEGLQQQLSELSGAHQTLLQNYNSLQEDYDELSQRHQQLNEEYQSLLVEYERLRALHEQLSETHQQLSSNYQSLLKDYHETVGELGQLREAYEELEARYSDLKERHEAALTTIGGLRSSVEDLEERVAEKEAAYQELQAMYNSAVNEGALTRNVLYAQSAAVAGIGAGMMILMAVRRRRTRGAERLEERSGPRENEGNNGRVQRVLSGRRITLPKSAAEKLGIKEGDRVVVQLLDDGVKIAPIKEERETREA